MGFRKRFEKAVKKAGQDIEKAVKKAASQAESSVSDIATLLPVASEISDIHQYIKEGQLEQLQLALDNLDADQLMISRTGLVEPPLQFALSKVIPEVDALVTHNKPLNGVYNPHLKIAALLEVYDTCKHKNSVLLEAKFTSIFNQCMEDKRGTIHDPVDVGYFIKQLVSHYTRVGNEFDIRLYGFKLESDYYFSIIPGCESHISISDVFTPKGKIVILHSEFETKTITETPPLVPADSSQTEATSTSTTHQPEEAALTGSTGPDDVD